MKLETKHAVMITAILLCIVMWSGRFTFAGPTKAEIEEAVAAISTYDFGQSRKTLLRVEKIVRETHGNAELRAHLEKQLVKQLESDATLASKQFVCRQLWVIGTDASVPVLARMLLEEETVEMACYAFASHPSRLADRALRAALHKARGKGLIAVINLLGERRAAQGVGTIAKLTASPDAAVADAAIAALGKIATGGAARVLANLRDSYNDHRRIAANHASLQCAQELERRGKPGEAKLLYDRLAASGEPEQVRRGARIAAARLQKSEADAKAGSDLSRVKAVPLFDGKTFTGWEGNLDMFRIEDGAIVAGTLEKPIPRNEFLCTKKEYRDFELRLKVKLLGPKESANAGIQVRSRRIPDHHEMIGYQADMGQSYWGNLYDESRRRKVLTTVNQSELARVLRPGDWNDYMIRCVGKRIQLWLNGYQTVDYTEPDDSIEQKGLIGLQIHSGPPSEAWYKDIMIKRVPR